MLKNIVVDTESKPPHHITINSQALITEAEARTHKSGPKTRMDAFIAGKTRLRRKPGWYPEEKKLEVCALFAAGVINSSDLERLTGINRNTIRMWRTADWWPEMLERVHTLNDQDTVSKFTKIIDKSLEVIQDRLNNGDYEYNRKTGEVHRRPVSLRDTAIVNASIVDKRQLLRGKPTSRSESISPGARLEKLAEEFKKFAAAKDITQEVEVVKDEI